MRSLQVCPKYECVHARHCRLGESRSVVQVNHPPTTVHYLSLALRDPACKLCSLALSGNKSEFNRISANASAFLFSSCMSIYDVHTANSLTHCNFFFFLMFRSSGFTCFAFHSTPESLEPRLMTCLEKPAGLSVMS